MSKERVNFGKEGGVFERERRDLISTQGLQSVLYMYSFFFFDFVFIICSNIKSNCSAFH